MIETKTDIEDRGRDRMKKRKLKTEAETITNRQKQITSQIQKQRRICTIDKKKVGNPVLLFICLFI